MKTQARVVVIGGGIGGVSTLYHLTREGWTDVVLVERDELTSGSTWHAASQVTQFGSNQTMIALKRHSIDLYRELAADPDYPINYHITGGMRLAHTPDEVDTYRHYVGMASAVGVEMEFIDAKQVAQRHPLMQTEGLLGAWWDPLDGDIDPAQLVFALARRARLAGAEIYRFNAVNDISRKRGEFIVHTINGDILCEKIVNASGYRVNEVGAMLGVVHPVVSMEHMYFLTEPISGIEALDHRVPIIRDPGDDFYCRQEKSGLLVGIYEQNCQLFGVNGIDPGFTKSLCPSDLERCLDNMDRIFQRLPCLTEIGIHTTINGPITYSADGAPLVGQVPELPGVYACLELRAGIGEGGGLGKVLAQIMVHGECEWDAWYLDPRRFGTWADIESTSQKAVEDYRNEFRYHLPHEHRPAARKLRTTELYSELDRRGCVWGVVNGWERALMFKPTSGFEDTPSYRFTATHEAVAKEIVALSTSVGLMEVSGFNRYEIRGQGAQEFLDHITCSQLPQSDGQIRLCYLLNENGHVVSEATIARLATNHYWYGSAASAELHDKDWLCQFIPESVVLNELTVCQTTLVVTGPRARELLQSAFPNVDFSHQAVRPMGFKSVAFNSLTITVMRVSFSGELAYELHIDNHQLLSVYQRLLEFEKNYDLVQFGLYAAESMRLEKGFLHWKADLIYEFNPFELGLERFVDLEKQGFVGKQALVSEIERGNRRQLAVLSVECDYASAHPGAPVWRDRELVGTVSSAGYGHRVEKNIAFAFLHPDHANAHTSLTVDIVGNQRAATVVERCLYDPSNVRSRS